MGAETVYLFKQSQIGSIDLFMIRRYTPENHGISGLDILRQFHGMTIAETPILKLPSPTLQKPPGLLQSRYSFIDVCLPPDSHMYARER